jgi:hypothetical protein
MHLALNKNTEWSISIFSIAAHSAWIAWLNHLHRWNIVFWVSFWWKPKSVQWNSDQSFWLANQSSLPRCEAFDSHFYPLLIFAIILPSISISRKQFMFTDSGYCNNFDLLFAQPLDGTRGRRVGVGEWGKGARPLARRVYISCRKQNSERQAEDRKRSFEEIIFDVFQMRLSSFLETDFGLGLDYHTRRSRRGCLPVAHIEEQRTETAYSWSLRSQSLPSLDHEAIAAKSWNVIIRLQWSIRRLKLNGDDITVS